MIIKYIIVFIIFSLLGWLYEYSAFNRIRSFDATKQLFNIDLPILPIYGVGGLLLLLIYEKLESYTLLTKVLVAGVIINLMECVLGICSYYFYGHQTWKYDNSNMPSCYGYVSVFTGLWWLLLSFVFFKSIEILQTKNKTKNKN